MATDVDVQYFSHLNGLTLGNNWGDLIRLLDKALVTGIDFTQITSASIDAQGDVHITLYAAHNAMLFQVVELSGFTPTSLNQKYRIKGVPSATQLILKPKTDIVERLITAIGAGKLAPLGYDIIFRDANDVKRVYRAKNPTAQHPFIRVDESISSDTGTYTSSYAKYAMVGLLESMTHIDDYQNPNVLQLPFDPSDPAKNWKITGAGTACIRGWSCWYWARNGASLTSNSANSNAPAVGVREFTLFGDADAFYFLRSLPVAGREKLISGCGLFDSALPTGVIPNWFLMTTLVNNNANTTVGLNSISGGMPLTYSELFSSFIAPKFTTTSRISASIVQNPLLPNYLTGNTTIFNGNDVAPLEIPFFDTDSRLRGSLKHVYYAGKILDAQSTTPLIADKSMYVSDVLRVGASSYGGVYCYLGDLE